MPRYRRFIATVLTVTSVGVFVPHLPAGAAPAPGITSVVPARLLDTRSGGRTIDGVGAGTGAVGFGTVDVAVVGRGGVPASGVGAVIVNVTAVNGRADGGYLTVYPAGGTRPNASSLNFSSGATVANELVTKVGAGGKITIYAHQATDLLVDIVGWVPESAGGLNALTPARLLDTRAGGQTIDGVAVGGGAPSFAALDLPVLGRGGVPASGVAAVVVNVTAVGGRANNGFITVYPTGNAQPNASSINFNTGTTVANELVTKVGIGGKITIYTHQSTDLLVDVVGWVPSSSTGLSAIVPARLLDTRSGGQTVDGVGAGGRAPTFAATDVAVTGRGGVPATGVGAVVINVTAAGGRANNGYLTVHPAGGARPNASSINFNSGTTVANELITKVGTGGKITIYTHQSTDLLVDVVGWIAGETAPPEPPPPPPPAAQKFIAVYARPKDVASDPSRGAAIAHDVGIVQGWYDGQTGGRHPVFSRDANGVVEVRSVELPFSSAELAAGDESKVTSYINGLAELGGAPAVIYLDAALASSYCGVTTYATRPTVVIPMPNCDIYPSLTSTWPYNATYLLGHEITHALGGAPSCAPHRSGGHVTDDPRDVIYGGPLPRVWNDIRLDVNHDDYYMHGIPGCPDINDSPLLGTG